MNLPFMINCLLKYAAAEGWDKNAFPSRERAYQAALYVEGMTIDPLIFDHISLSEVKEWALLIKDQVEVV